MQTTITVKKRKNEKGKVVHAYGNFYKCSNHGDLYQLVRAFDLEKHRVLLVVQPHAEIVTDPIIVEDPNNITEDEFSNICNNARNEIRLKLLKNVDFLVP